MLQEVQNSNVLDSSVTEAIKVRMNKLIEFVSNITPDGRIPNDNFTNLIKEHSKKDSQKVLNTLIYYSSEIDKATDDKYTEKFKRDFLAGNLKAKNEILMSGKAEGQIDDLIVNYVDRLKISTVSKLPAPEYFMHRFSDPIRAIRMRAEHSETTEPEFIKGLKKRLDGILDRISPHTSFQMQTLINMSKKGNYIQK